MKRAFGLLVIFTLLVVLAVADTPIGEGIGDVVQEAFLSTPTSEGIIVTPVAVTETVENTVVPTNTPTPTVTLTPTTVPIEILMTLEGGELFLRIEEALAAEVVSYNAKNGTDLEFISIIYVFEDLEEGSGVIELLDVNGDIIGFIPDDANWCIIDCENAASFAVLDFAEINFSSSITMTVEESYERMVLSNARLGELLGMLYYNPVSTACYFWAIEPWGPDAHPEKRLFLVDEVFGRAILNVGVLSVDAHFGGCPHDDRP